MAIEGTDIATVIVTTKLHASIVFPCNRILTVSMTIVVCHYLTQARCVFLCVLCVSMFWIFIFLTYVSCVQLGSIDFPFFFFFYKRMNEYVVISFIMKVYITL